MPLASVIDYFLQSGEYAARFSNASVAAINHIIFLQQENRSFDNYFGFLNAYRSANGWTTGDNGTVYRVDGLDGSKAQIVNPNDDGWGTALPRSASIPIMWPQLASTSSMSSMGRCRDLPTLSLSF